MESECQAGEVQSERRCQETACLHKLPEVRQSRKSLRILKRAGVCLFFFCAASVTAEAVISHEQEKRYEDQSHQPVMGNQHDQHAYSYKKRNESDYFFHLWKAPLPWKVPGRAEYHDALSSHHFIICSFSGDISGNCERKDARAGIS